MFQMALRRRRDNVGSQSVIGGSATEDFTLGDLTLEGGEGHNKGGWQRTAIN